MTLVSQAEFARMKSVSRKSVTVWKSRGCLVLNGELVDTEASAARILKYSSHKAEKLRQPPRVTPEVDVTLGGKLTTGNNSAPREMELARAPTRRPGPGARPKPPPAPPPAWQVKEQSGFWAIMSSASPRSDHYGVPMGISDIAACINAGAYDMMAVLLRHVCKPIAEGIITAWLQEVRRGYVGSPDGSMSPECVEEGWPPPVGIAEWHQHPLFNGPCDFGDDEWAGAAQNAAAWRGARGLPSL